MINYHNIVIIIITGFFSIVLFKHGNNIGGWILFAFYIIMTYLSFQFRSKGE